MAALHILGAVFTAATLALLGVGGYLAALFLFSRNGRPTDSLTLAVAALVLATGEAVAIGLALGWIGVLRFEPALALQATLVLVLFLALRRRLGGLRAICAPAVHIFERTWARCRDYPVLALVVAHAAGTELVRGLLRPPLSWDSLMYHLFLAGTWLRQGSFELVAAHHPTSFYQFMPGNGSVWLWWWMAPSHSELYTNVAFVPQWLLLGLATGAFARQLGARRHWPIASFLVVLIPTVVRFVATQYVDITVGALLVAGTVFAVRWLKDARWSETVPLALCGGLAAGTKVLALPFAGALALATVALARGRWRIRVPQLLVMALLAAPLGGFFYARNLAQGAGPFGYACAKQDESLGETGMAAFPSPGSPVDILPELLEDRMLTGAFLGVTKATMTELGVGPQVVLLVPMVLLVPFLLRGPHRRAGWILVIQITVQLALWMTVTYAASAHVFANVRYLVGGIALLLAAAVALGERFIAPSWLHILAVVLAIQDLLMLNPRMPYQVRVLLVWILVGTVILALAGALRHWIVRHWRPVTASVALCALLWAPTWGRFRVRDRERAFSQDYIAHLSTTRLFAAGWGWLDRNAGTGTVAVSHAPENFFVYPAMGPFLERRAVYVNVNEENHANPLRYPDCKTRIDPSREAWVGNLMDEGVRWVHLARYPELEFPLEDRWARSLPELFNLRFDDPTNRVYEVRAPGAEPR